MLLLIFIAFIDITATRHESDGKNGIMELNYRKRHLHCRYVIFEDDVFIDHERN